MSNPTELPDLDTDNVKTWPERIWLQHGCDEVPNYAETRGVEDGITWCEDNTAAEDIEYVRADLARCAQPEGGGDLDGDNLMRRYSKHVQALIDVGKGKMRHATALGGLFGEIARHVSGAKPEGEAPQAEAIELAGVREQIEEGSGFWSACSGCYETEDGHAVGHYPHSETLGCTLGGGCSECGGIGAIWDNNDYEAIGKAWEAEEVATLSPLCGAQHAESGAVSREAFDAAVSLAAETIDARNEEIANLRAAIAAQSQGAQVAGYFVFEHGCWAATSSDDPRAVKLYRAALAAKAEAPAPRVIGGQRWSKEAEMTEGWSAAQQAAAPGALLAILRDVHDTLASESDSDIDHFEDDEEEREGAPVQYAARKVMEVMDMLKAGTSAPGTPEAPDELEPMCEGCDNAATVHADGTTGLCQECVADDQRAAQLDGGQGEGDGHADQA